MNLNTSEKLLRVYCFYIVLDYYQRCNYDIDCQRNAFCVDNYSGKLGYCRCKPGFILQKNGTHYECLERKL